MKKRGGTPQFDIPNARDITLIRFTICTLFEADVPLD